MHGKALAAVDGDAVIDAETAGVLKRLLEGEATFEMHVVVDYGIVLSAEANHLAIEVVDRGAGDRERRRERLSSIRQGAHANVSEVGGAAWIVPLERKSSVIEDALKLGIGLKRWVGLQVVDNQHVIDAGLRAFAADQIRHREPFTVFREDLVDVADAIERPGLFALDVSGGGGGIVVFNLHFESCGRKPRGLKSCMKIDAGVRAGHGLDFDSKLEIPEIGAVDGPGVEEMRTFAMGDDLAINDLECALMLAGLPAVESFAIEKWESSRWGPAPRHEVAAGAVSNMASISRRVSSGMGLRVSYVVSRSF